MLATCSAHNPRMDQKILNRINYLINQGLSHQKKGELDQASSAYGEILQIDRNHFDALHLQGVIYSQRNEFELALTFLNKAKKINPKYAALHNNLGIALQNLKKLPSAIDSFNLAIALDSAYTAAYINRGNALQDLKKYDESIASYNKAIVLDPQNPYIHYSKAQALYQCQKINESIEEFSKSIALEPRFALALNGRGQARHALRLYAEATNDFDAAIALQPNSATFYNNKGSTLYRSELKEEALTCFKRATELDPTSADAACNYAEVLRELKKYDAAIVAYENAYSLNPNLDYLLGMLLHTKMIAWNWGNYESLASKIIEGVNKNKRVTVPFPFIGIQNDPKLEQKCAKIYAVDKNLENKSKFEFHSPSPARKIKVGYFSADFHDHPVAHLITGMLEHHDKAQFEIIGFSHGPIIRDESRKRIEKALDHTYDTINLSDDELVNLCRNIHLDIAIDLGGYTARSRFSIFSKRCAPVQINFLGFPGTMADSAYDYMIADKFLIPKEHKHHYTEKIIYLPSYQVNDSNKHISDSKFYRSDFGLAEENFVFACFNNSYKINPTVLKSWANILKETPNSVLWLANNSEAANIRLSTEFSKFGIEASRIVFAQRLPHLKDHLARLKLADLFLDTFFYNAHTTASDALWAGLPVITMSGSTFASRVAGSLLVALEIPELITYSTDEYERLAVDLAKNPAKLQDLREKINLNKNHSNLFNTQLYTRNIERSFQIAYENWRTKSIKDISIT